MKIFLRILFIISIMAYCTLVSIITNALDLNFKDSLIFSISSAIIYGGILGSEILVIKIAYKEFLFNKESKNKK